MKVYHIFIPDEETSIKVQESLFNVGFHWEFGNKLEPRHTTATFLTINYAGSRIITYGDDFFVWGNIPGWIEAGHTLIDANHVISSANELDGAAPQNDNPPTADIKFNALEPQGYIATYGVTIAWDCNSMKDTLGTIKIVGDNYSILFTRE